MFIKNFDFLSPEIGIFFYGKKRHNSIFGGIFTIIMVILCVLFIAHLIKDLFNHKSSNYVSYTKYQKDQEEINEFSFNSKELFHFFQFIDIKNDVIGKYNPEYIRIIMTSLYRPYSKSDEFLENNEHWIYDKCRTGIDDKNISKEIFLDTESDIINGACLRYYYNNIDKIYYSIEDELNFKYPYIKPKTKNNSIYLNTIFLKCNNNSILTKVLGNCSNENKIEEYLNTFRGIYLNILEYQVNTYNYSKPIIQYINQIYTEIPNFNSSYIQINNINFSPFYIQIQKGIFIPKIQKINTYIFNKNMQSNIYELSNKNIISIFNYEILNLCNVFEGGYNTLYDVLPNVGGIIQLIYYILFCFNYFTYKYTITKDSLNIFFKSKYINRKLEKENRSKFVETLISVRNSFKFEGNNNEIRYTLFPKKFSNKNLKNEININNEISSFNKIDNEIHEKNENQLNFSKEQKQKNLNNENNQDDFISNDKIILTRNNNFNTIENRNKNSLFKNNLQIKNRNSITGNYTCFTRNFINFLPLKKSNIKLEILSESYMRKNTSFIYYLITLMGNKCKRRKLFYIINGFREKLLSEEHFYRSHTYLYYLAKYFGITEYEKIDINELYSHL